MGIELTKGQKDGIAKAIAWYKSSDSKQIFEIAGFAGTGKSTMVYALIEQLGLHLDEVAFATYTGKAALVLRNKGCPAVTIHKLIYTPKLCEKPIQRNNQNVVYRNNIINGDSDYYGYHDNSDEIDTLYTQKVVFNKREKLEKAYKLLVLDECSMINESVLRDLCSFNVPIIVLGDKGQLPPIFGREILLRNPDVSLTEIMRQEEGSPITVLATKARKGERIEVGTYESSFKGVNKSFVVDRREFAEDINYGKTNFNNLIGGVQAVLCRTNKSRNRLNQHIRENIFDIHGQFPMINDKIICRKNNWDMFIHHEYELNLVNGLIGYVASPVLKENFNTEFGIFKLDFRPEMCMEDYFENLDASLIPFLNLNDEDKEILQGKQNLYYKKRKKKNENDNSKNERAEMCNLFEFAYAITVHLAQGSQFKRVFIYDEDYGYKEEHSRALYTAITRAEKTVCIAIDNGRQYYGWR